MSHHYGLICCHCHSKVRVRTSAGKHLLLRTVFLQCTNIACGATFRASFEITHALSPSGMPNPTISLPLAPALMHRQALKSLRGDDSQGDLLDELDEDEEITNATGAAR